MLDLTLVSTLLTGWISPRTGGILLLLVAAFLYTVILLLRRERRKRPDDGLLYLELILLALLGVCLWLARRML